MRGCWHYQLIRKGMRTPRKLSKAHLDVYGNIPVVHLYGSPEEMGAQYGALLRQPLRSLATCIDLFMPADKKARATRLADELEGSLPQDIRTELKAIARASGVPYKTLVAANATPNILCAALAVWGEAAGDGHLIFGRNSDYPAFGLERVISVIVVYHPDEGHPLVSVNYVGMIGSFTGVNARGVAFGNLITLNAKSRHMNKQGLAIQLHLRRTAHHANSADEFARRLVALKHLLPMNVMVADEGHAVVTELGVDAAEVRTSESGILAASNYFLCPALASQPCDCERYRSLIESANDNRGRYGVDTMKQALFAARIKGWNLQSVIVEPSKKLLHVAMNREPASAGPYTTFAIDRLLADHGNPLAPSGRRRRSDGS